VESLPNDRRKGFLYFSSETCQPGGAAAVICTDSPESLP
jgi:hypothetical protein